METDGKKVFIDDEQYVPLKAFKNEFEQLKKQVEVLKEKVAKLEKDRKEDKNVGSSYSPTVPTLDPKDTSAGIQLSLPFSNPLKSLFGTSQPYTIFGYAGSVYVSGGGGSSSSSSSSPTSSYVSTADSTYTASAATTFFVVPANPDGCRSRLLQYGQEFYLRTRGGLYLERYQRISTETPDDEPHRSPRFNLGFNTTSTQTWRVDFPEATGPVPNDDRVGLTIAGQNGEWTQPDNNIRRTLSLRGDGVSVVVQWWQGDEQVAFHTASYQADASSSF